MTPLVLGLSLLAALLPAQADTMLFPPRESLLRMYYDCDEARWPWGLDDTLVPKTNEEIQDGITRLRALEQGWRQWFVARAGDPGLLTQSTSPVYPLAVRGRLLDNFDNPREGGPHGALDIFVEREGALVRSPVTGVVVAAGDGWRGGWARELRDLWYRGGGLSRRAGNGVLIFEPATGAYHYLVHLGAGVLVATGDVVAAGQPIGRVGHTGNAARPGAGRHLHYALKRPGVGCGFDGVLVAVNPYEAVREARDRMVAGESR